MSHILLISIDSSWWAGRA